MKDLPIVYVSRPILRREKNGADPTVMGYIVSKAYLHRKTTDYVANGLTAKEYKIEYIGYESEIEGLMKNYGLLFARGFSKTPCIFEQFEFCKEFTSGLNRKLIQEFLEKKSIDEAVEIANNNANMMRFFSSLEERNLGLQTEDAGAYNE